MLVVVTIAAGAVIVGNTLSFTVMSWVAVAIFPEPSVTVQVTVVFPSGKVAGALLVTEATEQLSPVVGVPKANPVAVQAVLVVVTIAAGAVIVGTTLSLTVINCVAVAEFPAPSVTVQVTVVFPSGKVAGALFVTEATEQLSPVVGVPRANPVAVQAVLVVVTIAAGAVIVGSTLSFTVIN